MLAPDKTTYVYGDTIIATATPDPGWVFDAWSTGLAGSENPDTLIVTSDTLITAGFAMDDYTLTANITGSGSVALSPDQPTYVYGDTVIVTAVPATGWGFDTWSDGLSGSANPDTVVMLSDTLITANFTQNQYVLNAGANGNGSVLKSPNQATYVYGDSVIVAAVPDIGWAFNGWSEGLGGTQNPDTVVMMSDTTVTADFVSLPYTVTKQTIGDGEIALTPDKLTYEYGDTVVADAIPDPGWAFDSWSDGLTGFENPDTFVVTGSVTVTATFIENALTLTTGVIGDGSITLVPDKAVYTAGDTVLVTGVPDPGWTFFTWSGGLTGTENPDTIVMMADTSITAEFLADEYTITLSTTGNGSVQALPDQPTYLYGDTIIVTAEPDTGWSFDSWTAGLAGSKNPDTLVVVSDTTVTADFVLDQYVLTLETVGVGSVSKSPDNPTYVYGDTIIVTAEPDTGWVFDSWLGALAGGDNPDTLVMTNDTTLTATFSHEEYVLTKNTIGQGSINAFPDQATYHFGDSVIVTAVPDTGWVFDSWSDGLSGSDNPDTLVIAGDTAVTATFTAIAYTLTLNTVGDGSVEKAPDQATYVFGDTVVVTAVPDPGWVFDSWSDGLSGSENPDTLVMGSDTTVTATFTPSEYVITINVNGNGSVVKTPDAPTYAYGDTVIVTAEPDIGWSFDSWSDGLSGSNNPDTIIVASDTTITATFLANQYTLTTNVVGGGQIIKSPDNPTYVYGDTVFVTAVPNGGWSFTGWSDGLTGTENPDTVVMMSDTTVTATFVFDGDIMYRMIFIRPSWTRLSGTWWIP